MPRDPNRRPDLSADVADLLARVAALELAVRTDRIDVRDQVGRLRVRVGLIDEGTGRYGVRVWSSAGSLIVDDTAT